MSEDSQKDDAPVVEADVESTYLLCNTTRGRMNRTLRAQQPVHHRLKQYVAGGKYRVIRGRPIVLTEREITRHAEEIGAKIASGVFELRTRDGRLVDFKTGRSSPMPPTPPLPNPPLDSIANDKQNVGQHMPQFSGGDSEGVEGDVPELLKRMPAEMAEAETPPQVDEVPPPPPTESLPPELEPVIAATPVAVDEVPALLGGGEEPTPAPTKPEGKKKEKNK